MTTVLLTLHIIFAIVMVGIILIQKNEGGLGFGTGAMGGLMTSRGTTNLLTKMTAVLATFFFLTTLGLALLFKGSNKTTSILDAPATSAPAAPVTAPVQSEPLPVKNPDGNTSLPSTSPPLPQTEAQNPSAPLSQKQK